MYVFQGSNKESFEMTFRFGMTGQYEAINKFQGSEHMKFAKRQKTLDLSFR